MAQLLTISLGVLVLFGSLGTPTSAEELSRLNAFQREGLHHIDIRGTVVDAQNRPVAGTRVLIMSERLRGLPMKETLTDTGGQFHFNDVSSPYRVAGVIEPTSQYLPAYFGILGTSGKAVNVGEIRLARNTTLRAVVEVVSTKSVELRPEEISVLLRPESDRDQGNIVARWDGNTYILDHLRSSKYVLEVSYHLDRKGWYFKAPLDVEPGRQDRVLAIRVYTDTATSKSDYRSEGKLDFVEMLLPSSQKLTRISVSGILRAPEGSAISGAVVFDDDTFRGPWEIADSLTGPAGTFGLAWLLTIARDSQQVFLAAEEGS